MERQEIRLDGGGTLSVWEEGALVQMQVRRPDDRRGLYKVWIHGGSGRLLLGTLVPEQGELRLRRRLTRSQLEHDRCWPILGGESVLAFSFGQEGWQREEHPERLVNDVVLRQALKGQSMLLRQLGNGFLLSAPFDTGRPFPLTPLFCLSKVEGGRQGNRVVFSFDPEGNPILPHNQRHSGENSGTS